MLESIRKQIKETTERQAVMILLQTLDSGTLVALKIKSDSTSGELWIKDGKYLCFGKTSGGEGGLLDMLQLLSVSDAEFEVEELDGKAPDCELKITVAEVVADEHAVAKRIKDKLWPTDDAEAEKTPQKPEEQAEKARGDQEQDEPEQAAKAEPDEVEPDEDPVAKALVEPSSALASLFDDEEEDQTGGKADKGQDAPADQSGQENKPEQVPSANDGEEDVITGDQPVLSEDKQEEDVSADEEPAPAELSLSPDKIAAAIALLESTENDLFAVGEGALSEGQREHFEKLRDKLAEEPSRFYESDETAESVNYDDLEERRRADLTALDAVLARRKEEFEEQRLRATHDDLKSRRQQEYEAIKEFYGENKESFYQEPEDTIKVEGGLNDLQSRILDIVKEESADPKDFQSVDPKFHQGGDIRPSWEETPVAVPEEPPAQPPIFAAPEQEDFSPSGTESPYADVAGDVATSERLKGKLPVGGQADSLGLINRQTVEGRGMVVAAESRFRREGIPPRVMVAAVVCAVGIPLMSIIVWHFYDAKAQEEQEEQRNATLLAERSLEQKSVVAKPQEPFRMPAGGSSGPQPAPPNNSAGDQGLSKEQRSASFEYHSPASPYVMSGSQIAAADAEMRQGDIAMSSGNFEGASHIYVALVRRYPTYAVIRAKAAKAYIALKQYRQAYDICIIGLDSCQSRADFDMLVSVIREIP